MTNNIRSLRGWMAGGVFLLAPALANAATIAVPSPGEDNDIRPNLQSAVNSAANGDVLTLPAGRFKFSEVVTITKLVSIKGAGRASTVLYRSEDTPDASLNSATGWRAMLHFNINSAQPSNIRVRGITFKSKRPSITEGDGYSKAADVGLKFTNAVDFKVEGCRFENFGNGAISVTHADDLARGVIAGNEFFRNSKGFDGLGLGYGVVVYGANQKWVPDPKFGSNNFIFIENNTFDFHRHAIAAGGAALYVARYNIITNNIISQFASTQAIDAHEGRGGSLGSGNYFSTRAIEAYRNTIVNTLFHHDDTPADGTSPIVPGKNVDWLVERAIHIRGGEALVYSNTIDGYRFGVAVSATPFPGWVAPYPIPYAVGYLSGLALGAGHSGSGSVEGNGDVFYWSNSFNRYKNDSAGTPNPQSVEFYNYSTSKLADARDFHAEAKPAYAVYQYPHPLQCATDVNRDGKTTSADLGLLLAKFDQNCPALDACPTDVNKDGKTSSVDLNLLLAKFGQDCL